MIISDTEFCIEKELSPLCPIDKIDIFASNLPVGLAPDDIDEPSTVAVVTSVLESKTKDSKCF